MANEITANVPAEQAIMSVVTQKAKADSPEQSETGFSQILNECDAKTEVETDTDTKGEDINVDAVAAIMSGYVPTVSYVNIDEPVENIETDEESVQADEISIDSEMPIQNELPQAAETTESKLILNVEFADNTEYTAYAQDTADTQAAVSVSEFTETADAEGTLFENTAEDSNAEQFIGFINTNGFKANDIESVKYQTISQPIQNAESSKTFNDMEALIQRIFVDTEDEQTVENMNVEDTEVSADTAETVEFTAVSETADTAVTVEKEVSAKENTENTENIDFEINVDNESAVKTENKTDNDNSQDNAFGKNEDTQGGFEKLQVKNTVPEKSKNVLNITHTENFKIYNIDTSANTTQQVHRVMANTFTATGFLENVQESKEMVIQLNPESLGKIMIKLQSVGGNLDIEIKATNAEVREMLSAQMGQLSETIKEQGVNLNSMQIEQSALRNNKEQGGNANKDEREKKHKNDKDDETDYKVIMDDFESAFANIVGVQ